jgi:hypothetical protein
VPRDAAAGPEKFFADPEKSSLAYIDNGQAGRYLVNIGSHDEGQRSRERD